MRAFAFFLIRIVLGVAALFILDPQVSATRIIVGSCVFLLAGTMRAQ